MEYTTSTQTHAKTEYLSWHVECVCSKDTVHLRGAVVHTQYVDVLCTATCYLGTMTGSLLHVVVSGTVATWDTGATILLLLVVSIYT